MDKIGHNDTEIVVEVLDDCMIVSTTDTMHDDYKSWLKMDGTVISNFLRLFPYIVGEEFTNTLGKITTIKRKHLAIITIKYVHIV